MKKQSHIWQGKEQDKTPDTGLNAIEIMNDLIKSLRISHKDIYTGQENNEHSEKIDRKKIQDSYKQK